MKRHWLLTALGAILAGAGLHFLWQALPNPLFALISPVNESVWEHLKLLYWPMLAAALVLARGPRRIAVWAGFFPAGALLRPARARRAGACRRPDAVCPDHGGRLPACRAAQPQRACAQADGRFAAGRHALWCGARSVYVRGPAARDLPALRSAPQKNRFGRKWAEAIFECFCAKMIDQAASRTTATPSTRFAITSSP